MWYQVGFRMLQSSSYHKSLSGKHLLNDNRLGAADQVSLPDSLQAIMIEE
jgi:hypothetical protein